MRTHGVGGLGGGNVIFVRLRLSFTEQIFELAADGVTGLDDLSKFSLDGGQTRGRLGGSAIAPCLKGIAFSYEPADLNGPFAKGCIELLNSCICRRLGCRSDGCINGDDRALKALVTTEDIYTEICLTGGNR